MRTALFLKDKLHLWDQPQELWGRINQEQLGGLWKEIGAKHLVRILEVALQAIKKAYGGDEPAEGME